MGFIFFGLLFLLFDLNVSKLGIDILPDFVGWALMFFGYLKLSRHGKAFKIGSAVYAVAFVLGVLHVVSTLMGDSSFALKLFSSSSTDTKDAIFYVNTIYFVIKLLILTFTLPAICRLRDYMSDTALIKRTRTAWLILLAIQALYCTYAAFIEAHLPQGLSLVFEQILVIFTILVQVLFLIMIFKIKKDYRAY